MLGPSQLRHECIHLYQVQGLAALQTLDVKENDVPTLPPTLTLTLTLTLAPTLPPTLALTLTLTLALILTLTLSLIRCRPSRRS